MTWDGTLAKDGVLLCVECGYAMTLRYTGFTFEGDYAIHTFRLECQATGCQTSAELVYRTFAPQDLAAEREGD